MLIIKELLATIIPLIQPADLTVQIHKRQTELAYSPSSYPSPWMDPSADGWADAYIKAKEFVSQLTILEKVNLTTGIG